LSVQASLGVRLKSLMTLPAICAPMMLVSGPELVSEACKAGLMGALPRHNARDSEEFAAWLASIRDSLDRHREEYPRARIGPLAVNIVARKSPADLRADLEVCARYGVGIIISALGNPTALTRIVHDFGASVFHDVTDLHFAAKAIDAGVDGLTCIGSGGGGHSGTLNSLAFIPRVRELWDGIIVFAGSVSNGAAVRAAEVLGADFAYLGTRFIATQESRAPAKYKEFLVNESSQGLIYTERLTGVPANWLQASLRAVGLDPADLPVPQPGAARYAHLPDDLRPWRDIWSAGQGIDLIHDIPPVAELVARLRAEYVRACDIPSMAVVAASELDVEVAQPVVTAPERVRG
jgi:nitronate monooxygenase